MYEWRKQEKALYLPTTQPQLILVPAMQHVCIQGAGNPNGESFEQRVSALYAFSYALKMGVKKHFPDSTSVLEYRVYPLTGYWDISDAAKIKGSWQKEDLVYTLYIRQPDFLPTDFVEATWSQTLHKNKVALLDKVEWVHTPEEWCIQALHIGSYDEEPATFAKMEAYAASIGYARSEKTHTEIYLSDPRRVSPEKLKTVLRFRVHKLK
ncbi:MAG: GyrI-like domain-containing protein [Erysipelotrichaceae bacterium]